MSLLNIVVTLPHTFLASDVSIVREADVIQGSYSASYGSFGTRVIKASSHRMVDFRVVPNRPNDRIKTRKPWGGMTWSIPNAGPYLALIKPLPLRAHLSPFYDKTPMIYA